MGVIKSNQIANITGGTGIPYNHTFAADGTRRFSGFEITFDRPIDVSTFNPSDVEIHYHHPNLPAGIANDVVISSADYTITPLDTAATFGLISPVRNAGRLASRFLVMLIAGKERSQVGTYSFAVRPDIRDRIRTTAAGNAGNFVDQDQDGITREFDTLAVVGPPAVPARQQDTFAIPTPKDPTKQGPFDLPFDSKTLPIILPGPYVTATQVPNVTISRDNLVLNQTNNALDFVFNRDIDPTSFTVDNIKRLMGPVGVISNYRSASSASITAGSSGSPSTRISTISVPDSLVVKNLGVQVNVTHAAIQNLAITLIAPDGTRVPLVARGTLSGANLQGTRFDDHVTTPIIAGTAPYATVYRPTAGSLRTFDGKNYAGDRMNQDQDGLNGEDQIPFVPGLVPPLPTEDIYRARFLFQPGTNAAPQLTGSAYAFPPNPLEHPDGFLENDFTNLGTAIPYFLGNTPTITDADDPRYTFSGQAPRGIAITSVDNTNGTWQYSRDGGITWADVGSPTASAALLLESAPQNRLRFVPNPEFHALATFTFRAWDLTAGLSPLGADGGIADTTTNGGTTAFSTTDATATVEFFFVNKKPTFVKGPNQTVLEDSGPHTIVGWATRISPDVVFPPTPDEAGQTLTVFVSNNNSSLFLVPPAIDVSTGTLTYTLVPNVSGVANVSVYLKDDGGTLHTGNDTSDPQTFVITVLPVNDAPTFTSVNNYTVNEDSGPISVPGFATISAGPLEASQIVTVSVTNGNNPLFSVQPNIAANGTLTFTPAPNANGTVGVTVHLRDDGSTANGGVDSSGPFTFTITINAVNDVPIFTPGPDQNVLEDSGPHSIANWATGISAGAANESGQTLTFNVLTNSNP